VFPAVWRVSLCWQERTVGWVRWSSAHRSISSVVALACKMTPDSSLTFFYRTLLITVWYVPDYHIRVIFRECEIGLFVFMYRVCSRCLISIDLPVWPTHDFLHVLHLIYVFHWSLFCFMVFYRMVDCICYMFEILCLIRCV
jgi:hypothetical protein